MRCLRAACMVSALLGLYPVATRAETITIGRDAFAFHEEVFRDLNLNLETPAVNDVEILVELIGIPNVAKINALRLQIRRSVGLKNAFAYFDQGYRSIVYDPAWAASATAEFYLVLGHEAGHHFCGHTVGQARTWDTELEADRFGGASIKRFEVYHNRTFFGAVMAAATAKYTEQGSPLYPPRALRLEAIKNGYEQGSTCGGLAPVEQRGFTRGAR
jgi:hypothetical protein